MSLAVLWKEQWSTAALWGVCQDKGRMMNEKHNTVGFVLKHHNFIESVTIPGWHFARVRDLSILSYTGILRASYWGIVWCKTGTRLGASINICATPRAIKLISAKRVLLFAGKWNTLYLLTIRRVRLSKDNANLNTWSTALKGFDYILHFIKYCFFTRKWEGYFREIYFPILWSLCWFHY